MVKSWSLVLVAAVIAGCNLLNIPPTEGQYIPAAAFTATNTNGRPMNGAAISITNAMGVPQTVYSTAAGAAFTPTVPATGVVQFFGPVGTYIVTVSGSGVTRQFYAAITAISSGSGITSFNTDTGPSITLALGTTGTDLGIDAPGTGTITLNVPDAGAGVRGVINTGGQVIEGAKNFSTAGFFNLGWTVNNSSSAAATANFKVKTSGSAYAINVESASNSVGFFTSAPSFFNSNVYIAGQTGKTGLVVTSQMDQAAIIGSALTGAGVGVTGYASGTGIGVVGQSVISDAMAAHFLRVPIDGIGSVPVVKMSRDTSGDTQPILEIAEDDATSTATYTVRGTFNAAPTWGITPAGAFEANPDPVKATYGFIGDNDSGLTSILGGPCLMDEGACVLLVGASSVAIQGTLAIAGGLSGVTTLAMTGAISGATNYTSTGFNIAATYSATPDVAPVFHFTGDEDSGLGSILGGPCIFDEGGCVVLVGAGQATVTGELTVTGVVGTGKAVCVKADGNLGVCADVPNGSGVCTCG